MRLQLIILYCHKERKPPQQGNKDHPKGKTPKEGLTEARAQRNQGQRQPQEKDTTTQLETEEPCTYRS